MLLSKIVLNDKTFYVHESKHERYILVRWTKPWTKLTLIDILTWICREDHQQALHQTVVWNKPYKQRHDRWQWLCYPLTSVYQLGKLLKLLQQKDEKSLKRQASQKSRASLT